MNYIRIIIILKCKCCLDEEYSECGNSCDYTCGNIHDREPKLCCEECRRGCFCRFPLLRAGDGSCYQVRQCPLPDGTMPHFLPTTTPKPPPPSAYRPTEIDDEREINIDLYGNEITRPVSVSNIENIETGEILKVTITPKPKF